MIRKFFKWIVWILIFLLLAVLGVLAFGLGTDSGLKQILSVAQKQAPGELTVGHSSGRLLGASNLKELSYKQDDGLELTVGEVTLDWKPQELFSKQFQLDSFSISDVDVYLPPSSPPPSESSPITLPEIKLPLNISVNDISINDVRVFSAGVEKPLIIESAKLKADFSNDGLVIREFRGVLPEAELKVSGSVKPEGNYPIDLALNWTYKHKEFGTFHGEGDITGDIEKFHLEHGISGNADVNLTADVVEALTSPKWDADVTLETTDLGAFSADLKGSPLQANIQSKGNLDDFSAMGDLNTNLPQTGPAEVKFSAEGNLEKILVNEMLVALVGKPTKISVDGAIHLTPLSLDLHGGWKEVHWPLEGEVEYVSPRGDFSISGPLTDYVFELTADAKGKSIPAGDWKLSGKGTDKALGDFNLLGRILEGELAVKGNAKWQPQPEWNVEISAKDVNPGVHWKEYPAKLATRLTSKGRIVDGVPNLVADIAQMDGMFRGLPLAGQGHVAVNGQTIQLKDIKLSSGEALLHASGSIADALDVEWRVESPELSTLIPDLKGAVKGEGVLAGTKDKPLVKLNLDVRNLVSGDTEIKKLSGKGNIDISGANQSMLDFSGSDLKLAGNKWDDFTLKGAGTPAKHELDVSLGGELATLVSSLKGGMEGQVWKGELSKFQAKKTEFGDWVLKAPAPLEVSAASARAEKFCLDSKPSQVCINGSWDQTKGAKGQIDLAGINPMRFKDYLPVGMDLSSLIEGKATGSMTSEGRIDAHADLVMNPGVLSVDSDAAPINVDLGKSTINATMKGERLDSKLNINLGTIGNVESSSVISKLLSKPTINGSVKADLGDLTVLGKLIPDLDEVKGRLKADLNLSGPLEEPLIAGELRLEGFAAEVPAVAIAIEDTEFVAKSSGTGPLLITGHSRSGEGKLDISGKLEPASKALSLTLKGDQYQVANSNKMRAVISPDMNISMDAQGMKVDGTLTVPSAYINAGGGSGEGTTITSSKDIVLIDETGTETAQDKTNNMNLNLRVVLGDDIKVEAPGFSGALKGNLVIEQTPELAPRGTGTLEIVNGDYVVYGQKLNMQRGRVLFSGGPIDNPKLDMDVARDVEAYEVLAGARIRGTAQAPQVQLYSEPSMPDASILSFMLLGQPPGTKGGSYTLGKYLTPDLYVSYGIGLFNVANTFNMRYKLTDKLAVQAESGAANSADLIYTIER